MWNQYLGIIMFNINHWLSAILTHNEITKQLIGTKPTTSLQNNKQGVTYNKILWSD